MIALLRNKVGMTLIEVMVTVTILGILIAPLAGLFVISNYRAHTNVVQRQALAVAETKMESLRQSRFYGYVLTSTDPEIITEETSGKFTVITHSAFDDSVGMTRITVTVSLDEVEVSLSTFASGYRR